MNSVSLHFYFSILTYYILQNHNLNLIRLELKYYVQKVVIAKTKFVVLDFSCYVVKAYFTSE